jgi:hypothetical protein
VRAEVVEVEGEAPAADEAIEEEHSQPRQELSSVMKLSTPK